MEQLGQIKSLISSTIKSEKSFAYSSLIHLQEQSTVDSDSSVIQLLVESSGNIFPAVITDIGDDDEEVAALALKCLGFMLYHPSIASSIAAETTKLVIDSLTKVIITTKFKSICNLGVWCISVQQLEATFLAAHFSSLLRAIVHSLDNPMGSLSTTFEGIQAVTNIATQVSGNMWEASSIWMPPIYRRLLSTDKREREICQRCLLKINSVICPPQSAFSRVVVEDMRTKLLPRIKQLFQNGKKVQALQAWGWYIRFIGSYALKHRNLVNEMLKIPEQAFLDQDPQVQIASQVAWEGLMDALLQLPPEFSYSIKHEDPQVGHEALKENWRKVQSERYMKYLKLMMTPLVGVMSRHFEASVRSSCLNTWSYFLHKLDTFVNDPRVVSAVVEPMLKTIIEIGPGKENSWCWNFCISLLRDYIQAKIKSVKYGSSNPSSCNLTTGRTSCELQWPAESTWKHYSVKWLPWDCSQLDFLLRMNHIVIRQVMMATSSVENRTMACDAALRIFRSILKGVHIDFNKSSGSYEVMKLLLDKVLTSTRSICETISSKNMTDGTSVITCLHFIVFIVEELDPSVLSSAHYNVPMDLQFVDKVQSAIEPGHKKLLNSNSIIFMDMVTPVVYLTVLYLYVAIQAMSEEVIVELFPKEVSKFVKLLLFSYNTLDIVHSLGCFLYNQACKHSFRVWIAISQGLNDCLDSSNSIELFKTESSSVCLALCRLLIYPLVIFSHTLFTTDTNPGSIKACGVLCENIRSQQLVDMWKLLYCSIGSVYQLGTHVSNGFAEVLCSLLNEFIDGSAIMKEGDAAFDSSEKHVDLLLLFVDFSNCILENLHIEKATPGLGSDCKQSRGIEHCIEFVARILKLSRRKRKEEKQLTTVLVPRLFSTVAHFVSRLQLKEDILLFNKNLCHILPLWLSEAGKYTITTHWVQLLWTEILHSLHRSFPSILFDSSFLQLQAPVLKETLDHSSLSMSEPTVRFWNCTYGEQSNLDFPPCLLPTLDKLSRQRKISIKNNMSRFFETRDLKLSRYETPASLNIKSKRVKLLQETKCGAIPKSNLASCLKKRKLELTEHQKEVRRAQQGREDCSGHGPGVRTYTSADFSQGNDGSQDSQDIGDDD